MPQSDIDAWLAKEAQSEGASDIDAWLARQTEPDAQAEAGRKAVKSLVERRRKAGQPLMTAQGEGSFAGDVGKFVRGQATGAGQTFAGIPEPQAGISGIPSNLRQAGQSLAGMVGTGMRMLNPAIPQSGWDALARTTGIHVPTPTEHVKGMASLPVSAAENIYGGVKAVGEGKDIEEAGQRAGRGGAEAFMVGQLAKGGVQAGKMGIEAVKRAKAGTFGGAPAPKAAGKVGYWRARPRPVTKLTQTTSQQARAALEIPESVLDDRGLSSGLDLIKAQEPNVKGGLAATAEHWADGAEYAVTDLLGQYEKALDVAGGNDVVPGSAKAMKDAEIAAIVKDPLDPKAHADAVAEINKKYEGITDLTRRQLNTTRRVKGQALREHYKKGPSARAAQIATKDTPASLKAQRDAAARLLYEGTEEHPATTPALQRLNEQIGHVTKIEDALNEGGIRDKASVQGATPRRKGLMMQRTPGGDINKDLSDVMRKWPTVPKPVQAEGGLSLPARQAQAPTSGPSLGTPMAGQRVHPLTGEVIVDRPAPITPTSLETETMANIRPAPATPQTGLEHPLQAVTQEVPRVQGEAVATTPVNVQSQPPLPTQTPLTHPLATQVEPAPQVAAEARPAWTTRGEQQDLLPVTEAFEQGAGTRQFPTTETTEPLPESGRLGSWRTSSTEPPFGTAYVPPEQPQTVPSQADIVSRVMAPPPIDVTAQQGALGAGERPLTELPPGPQPSLLQAPTEPATIVPTGGVGQAPGAVAPMAPAPGPQTVTPTLSTEPGPQMADRIARVTEALQNKLPGIDPTQAANMARDVVAAGTWEQILPEVPPTVAAPVQGPPPAAPQAPAVPPPQGLAARRSAPVAPQANPAPPKVAEGGLPIGSTSTSAPSDVRPGAQAPSISGGDWRRQGRFSTEPMTAAEEAEIDAKLRALGYGTGERGPTVQETLQTEPMGFHRPLEPVTPRPIDMSGGFQGPGPGGETVLPLAAGPGSTWPPPSPQGLAARRAGELARASGNPSEAQLHNHLAQQADAQALQQQVQAVQQQMIAQAQEAPPGAPAGESAGAATPPPPAVQALMRGGFQIIEPTALKGAGFLAEDGSIVQVNDHADALRRAGIIKDQWNREEFRRALEDRKLVRVRLDAKENGPRIAVQSEGPISDSQLNSLGQLAEQYPNATVDWDMTLGAKSDFSPPTGQTFNDFWTAAHNLEKGVGSQAKEGLAKRRGKKDGKTRQT